jgi:hypothetical protein
MVFMGFYFRTSKFHQPQHMISVSFDISFDLGLGGPM